MSKTKVGILTLSHKVPYCALIFPEHISLIYENLLYKYIVCQPISEAIKDRNVKI